jgi:predicted nuclease of restriction endonuclease-like (RecB) superfamily
MNPNFGGNIVRRFNVDSDDIGTEDLNIVARQAAIDIPGEDWELHKVFTDYPVKQEIFIEFKE